MSLYEFDNILRKLIQETIEENVINGKVLDGEKLETAIKELYSKETMRHTFIIELSYKNYIPFP